VSQGRNQEALVALANTCANGNIDDAAVLIQYREVTDTLSFEQTYEKRSFVSQFLSSATTRKRIFLVSTVAVFCMLSGNNIVCPLLSSPLFSLPNSGPLVAESIVSAGKTN
jgi:predicted small integral membrane protein